MNDREEFLQFFRSEFIKMVERLDTMTESQVLDGLLEVRTARKVYEEEFAERIEKMIQPGPRERPQVAMAMGYTREQLAYLVSVQTFWQAFFNSLEKLRSRAGARARSGGTTPFDSLEYALNEQLESLRKRPSGDF